MEDTEGREISLREYLLAGVDRIPSMNNVRPWFEGELKRMLGFDEVSTLCSWPFFVPRLEQQRTYMSAWPHDLKDVGNSVLEISAVMNRGILISCVVCRSNCHEHR